MDQDLDDFEDDLEQLEELEVLDGTQQIEDDEGEMELEVDESEVVADDVPDTSFLIFQDHQDAVYCAAFHPSIDGLMATGSCHSLSHVF
jgi:hypothetical protein